MADQSLNDELELDEGFEALLNKIREDRLPPYGSVEWDGKKRESTTSVLFKAEGKKEPDAAVKRRALNFLENLTPEETRKASIKVFSQAGQPVRAEIKAGTKELSPERLEELERGAGLKK